MGLIIRLVLLLGSLALMGTILGNSLARMFATAQEILVPFVLLSGAILVLALAWLLSTFRRR